VLFDLDPGRIDSNIYSGSQADNQHKNNIEGNHSQDPRQYRFTYAKSLY